MREATFDGVYVKDGKHSFNYTLNNLSPPQGFRVLGAGPGYPHCSPSNGTAGTFFLERRDVGDSWFILCYKQGILYARKCHIILFLNGILLDIFACTHVSIYICCFHCSVFTYSNLKPFALCGLCIHFIFVVSWMELSGLHLEFEKNTVIRRRFQQEKSWLQWPGPVQNKNVQGEGDESEEEVEKQPICTKSLELNVDAVSIMMNFLNGNFANIDTLKREAILADPHCFSPSPHYESCSQMCPLAHICISIT